MRRVELLPGMTSSAVGFGCASVLGAVGAKRSRIAIHAALDAGITHFDLARSYGFGDAESFVGSLLRTQRQSLQLATKFGIRASACSRLLRPAKPVIRLLKGRKHQAPAAPISLSAPDSNSRRDRFHSRVDINPRNMTLSLHRSLRALKTDYVDYFLIHEPPNAIARIDEVLECATKLKQSGKIRAIGLATPQWDDAHHRTYAQHFDLLQFCRPAGNNADDLLQIRGNFANIMFGVHRNRHGSPSVAELSAHMRRTVFLYSMFTPSHIRENAQQLSEQDQALEDRGP